METSHESTKDPIHLPIKLFPLYFIIQMGISLFTFLLFFFSGWQVVFLGSGDFYNLFSVLLTPMGILHSEFSASPQMILDYPGYPLLGLGLYIIGYRFCFVVYNELKGVRIKSHHYTDIKFQSVGLAKYVAIVLVVYAIVGFI